MEGLCLLVDPDEARRQTISQCLNALGCKWIVSVSDLQKAEAELAVEAPLALAVVGVARPVDAGLGLLSRLRVAYPDCTIVALDLADCDESAARAFHAGAHDVLRMPFRQAEFEVRLARCLVKKGGEPPQEADAEALIGELSLTKVEMRILRYFVTQQGRVVTRNELSQHLYGTDWSYRDRRFDVHVGRIRRKLETALGGRYTITSIRSVGYMFDRAG